MRGKYRQRAGLAPALLGLITLIFSSALIQSSPLRGSSQSQTRALRSSGEGHIPRRNFFPNGIVTDRALWKQLSNHVEIALFVKPAKALDGGDESKLDQTWRSALATMLLAVRHFNSRDGSVFPDFARLGECTITLDPLVFESDCSLDKLNVDIENSDAEAAIGPACVNGALAEMSRYQHLPTISYDEKPWEPNGDTSEVKIGDAQGTGSNDGDSIASYPKFFRMAPQLGNDALPLLRLFLHAGHTQVAVLHGNSPTGSVSFAAIEKEARRLPLHVREFDFLSDDLDTLRHALSNIKASGIKTILSLCDEQYLSVILGAASKQGLLDLPGPAADSRTVQWVFTKDISEETLLKASKVVPGTLTPFLVSRTDKHRNDLNTPWQMMRQWWSEQSARQLDSLTELRDGDKYQLFDSSALAYDAVAALGLAFCQDQTSGASNGKVTDDLINLNFVGTSGAVAFGRGTRARQENATMLQLGSLQKIDSGARFNWIGEWTGTDWVPQAGKEKVFRAAFPRAAQQPGLDTSTNGKQAIDKNPGSAKEPAAPSLAPQGYHLGNFSQSICWRTGMRQGEHGYGIKDQLNQCPSALSLQVVHPWLTRVAAQSDTAQVVADLNIGDAGAAPWSLNSDGTNKLSASGGYVIPSFYLHICASSVRFCTPFLGSLGPDMLASTEMQRLGPVASTHVDVPISLRIRTALPNLKEGRYTVLVHAQMYSDGGALQWDIASAFPLDVSDHDKENMQFIGAGIARLGKILFSFNAMACIAVSLWTFAKRNHLVVKASQVRFLRLVLAGVFFSNLTIWFSMIEDGPGEERAGPSGGNHYATAACQISVWTYVLGFCLLFAPLSAKLKKTHSLRKPGVALARLHVSNKELALHFTRIALVDMLLVATWFVRDAPVYVRTDLLVDSAGLPIRSQAACVSDSAILFLSLISANHMCHLGVAMARAVVTANVRTPYSENRYVAVAVLTALWLTGIVVPVVMINNVVGTARVQLIAMMISLTVNYVLVLLYFPKMVIVHSKKTSTLRSQLMIDETEEAKVSPKNAMSPSVESHAGVEVKGKLDFNNVPVLDQTIESKWGAKSAREPPRITPIQSGWSIPST